MKEALWYERLAENKVHCRLCPHDCTFSSGGRGKCRVRENVEGTLYSTNYGKAGGYGLDPVEKKPLYHFYPGTHVLSVGARGCNFKCEFCQNWQLAQGEHQEVEISPFGLISDVERYRTYYQVTGLAYTYSEPFMWYEFVLETCKLAKEHKMKNVIVTNGFIKEEPLKYILPYLDAMNIDVKAFTEDFYQKVAHGSLAPVLDTAEKAKEFGCHVEITTLLIPGLNDSEGEIKRLVEWVASALGRDTPVHFSRYFPNYKMKIESTPIEVLERAREIALEKLDYVYLGNLGRGEYLNTFCPSCKSTVVVRDRGPVDTSGLEGNQCIQCGYKLNLIT